MIILRYMRLGILFTHKKVEYSKSEICFIKVKSAELLDFFCFSAETEKQSAIWHYVNVGTELGFV